LSVGLFNYLVRLLSDWHYAEDILVETFTKLANSNLKESGSLKAWLYRVSTNACYKLFRKNRGDISFCEEIFQQHINDSMPDLIKEIRIQKLLSELSENQRVVIVLKFYEEMSYQEIADTLCCPLGTVKSRMHEGIKNLRRMMVRKGNPALCAKVRDTKFCSQI
jgi:RNA polymerase sigma-70 factor (ECF subfamily)